MQTHFTAAQLADPQVAESEKILRSCVHCGFCTATCPTYVLLGDELDSPRGRIYLIKDMLETGRPADRDLVTHIDRCLSCLSCMTTCPSGVNYMHLVDHARAHIEQTYRRPLLDRLPRGAAGGRAARSRPVPRRTGAGAARQAAGPGAEPDRSAEAVRGDAGAGARTAAAVAARVRPAVHAAEGSRRRRVAILSGCAQPVLAPAINAAAIRLLARLGVEVA